MPSSARLLPSLILIAAAGCSMERSVATDSAVDLHPGPAADLDLWDEIATRPAVTNNDALHGLLQLVMDDEVPGEFQLRVDAAVNRGWIESDRLLVANESAMVGMISVAVCEILAVEGGVTMRVFGPSPRYCTRELVYLQLMPPRTAWQALSGLEFIDLVSRVEDRVASSADTIGDGEETNIEGITQPAPNEGDGNGDDEPASGREEGSQG